MSSVDVEIAMGEVKMLYYIEVVELATRKRLFNGRGVGLEVDRRSVCVRRSKSGKALIEPRTNERHRKL